MADPTPNPNPNPTTKWFDGFEDADKGVVQNRNWHELPVEEAAKAIFAYGRDLEKKLGIPADQVLRVPSTDNPEEWRPIYDKLGVPKDAAGYDFSTVKNGDGSALDEGFVTTMRDIAAKNNLPAKAAAAITEAILRYGEKAEADENMADMVEVQRQKDLLAQSWGGNAETFKFIADRAASMIGLTPEELNAIASTTSYANVMNGLLKIGQKAGEAALLMDNNGNGMRAMTREQAAARMDDIQSGRDPDFVKRWRAGEKAAADEFAYLNRTIVGARA